MNVLFLDQFNDPGGAQQCLLDLLPAVISCGWRATVGLPGSGSLRKAFEELGMETSVISCGPFGHGRKSLPDIARFAAQMPVLARQITALAERMRADLIYLNGPRLLPACALARPRGAVLFHGHHCLDGVTRRAAAWGIRRLDPMLIANSRMVADTYENASGKRARVIYNGVPGPSRPRRRVAKQCPVVGCIGRISPQKGQHQFVEAARRIAEFVPGARFVVQGSPLFGDAVGAAYEQKVRAAAADLPIEFRSWAGDVSSFWSEVDLIIVPSLYPEATTRVVLEAFAWGVPVIATRSGGIDEVIDDGVNGYLALDSRGLASRAIELLADPQRVDSIVESAHACWSQHFTVEGYRAQVLRAMEEAAARSRKLE